MTRPHRLTSRARGRLVLAALALAAVGGCTRDLSRREASAILLAHEAFKVPLQTQVAIGRLSCDWRNVDRLYHFKELQENGILAYTPTGIHDGWTQIYDVGLTAKGEAAAVLWIKTDQTPTWCTPQEGAPPAVVYAIPLAIRELVGVTGVVQNPNGGKAVVDFDWKWTPGPQSAALPSKVPRPNVHHAQAAFARYDDGWRITELALGGGGPFDG